MTRKLRRTMKLFLAALLVALPAATAAKWKYDGVYMSAVLSASGELSLVERRTLMTDVGASGFAANEAATALFNDTSYAKTGWATLSVKTNPAMADATCASAAGQLEGKITAQRILQHAINSGQGPKMVPTKPLTEFVEVNNKWIASQQALANLSTAADKAYWHQQQLVYLQLAGMHAGYAAAAAELKLPALLPEAILYLNMGDEMGDFAGFKPGEGFVGKGARPLPKMGDVKEFEADRAGRCSALIKLTTGNADLMIAQETWTSLESMLRIYKMYDFPFTNDGDKASGTVAAQRVSFSSYPAVLNSGDDFYVTSSGLVVQETTIGNSNPALVKEFVSPLSLMEWLRNILANRMAATGLSWPGLYAKYNSGSYCNQNMILDYNLFKPGKPLVNGTVIVSEQIPGYVFNSDVSELVNTKGYYGSYNAAFDPYVRRLSGAQLAEAKGGPWYGYWSTARAQIFKRDQGKVKSVADLQMLMRQCKYKTDPLSHQQCLDGFISKAAPATSPVSTTENCIATRGDLNPADGKWCVGSFAHRDHVGSDAKISAFSTFDKATVPATIVSGPTYGAQSGGGLPVFCWSTSTYNVSHEGHPDCFNFDWVTTAGGHIVKISR